MIDTKLIRLLRSYEIMTNGFKKEMRKMEEFIEVYGDPSDSHYNPVVYNELLDILHQMELAEDNALEYLKEDDEE